MKQRPLEQAPRLTRCFDNEQIAVAIENDQLLSVSVKLPVGCNLRCRYCYSQMAIGDMDYQEVTDFISQAASLGAKSLSIIGEGEPMLYVDKKSGKIITDIIAFANDLHMEVIVFTNNIKIDDAMAERLFQLNMTVVCKLNSLEESTQDLLCGVKGAAKKIKHGLAILERAGFTKRIPSRLSVHTVICRQNLRELPDLWKNLRQRNIIPYVQVLVPPANQNREYFKDLEVSPEQTEKLFFKLMEIDRYFGFSWEPDMTYPIAALGCSVVKTGCCINSQAKITICGYLEEVLGDLRQRSLAEIIKSPKIRMIRKHVYKGANPKNPHFYGCRAAAFNVTQDRFAPDPLYWQGGA
jgi:MoaA/NifB/PqqE/SkfB family radical SAM enzyme